MLTTVSAKEMAPILAKSAWLGLSTEPVRMRIAWAQQIPAFTAGGSSDADIATPTKEAVLLPRILNATPMPLVSENKEMNQTPITGTRIPPQLLPLLTLGSQWQFQSTAQQSPLEHSFP